MWDQRYSDEDYFYGTRPNDFVVEIVGRLEGPKLLSLGEGEGRNAVYLAEHGFTVHGVDGSEIGLRKAERLAADRGVRITTEVVRLEEYAPEAGGWDSVLSIFCHLPSSFRREAHRTAVGALRPGGTIAIEAYTPRQLEYGTGGPPSLDLLYGLDTLLEDLSGLVEVEIAEELERDVQEGSHHRGLSHVARLLGRRLS